MEGLELYILGSICGVLFVLTLVIIFMFAKSKEGMTVNPKYYRDYITNWKWKYDNRNKFFTPTEYCQQVPYKVC